MWQHIAINKYLKPYSKLFSFPAGLQFVRLGAKSTPEVARERSVNLASVTLNREEPVWDPSYRRSIRKAKARGCCTPSALWRQVQLTRGSRKWLHPPAVAVHCHRLESLRTARPGFDRMRTYENRFHLRLWAARAFRTLAAFWFSDDGEFAFFKNAYDEEYALFAH